ncbi:MAG: M28 family peptidase [bacterium]
MVNIRFCVYSFLFLSSISEVAFAGKPTRTAMDSIRPQDVRRHINFLASDSLRGRNTPGQYLDTAAAYIAEAFKSYGLEPLDGSYFQQFHLDQIHLGTDNFFTLRDSDHSDTSFQIKRDFMPFEFTAHREIAGALVFAGYGITAPELNYDDYAGLDVTGKVVVVLKHEPGEKDPNSVFEGENISVHGINRTKVENAIAHGAAGIIIMTDPLNHRSLRPRGFPWPSLYKNIPNSAIAYTLALLKKKKIPAIQAGKALMKKLFVSIDSLKALQKRIDATLSPHSFEWQGKSAAIQTSIKVVSHATQNVAALRQGRDPDLKKEVIIIGAHYDHVGIKLGEIKDGEDYIYNGADDNASGTGGLLEIAEAFSKTEPPKRSVIFIAFAGEEKGLFGSRYYTEKPLWPLTQTKAMLNMDMIGRNQGDKVSIIGYARSPELNTINTEENQYVGLKLQYDGEQFFRRSDHYSFARKNIPVLLYNTGIHQDYHKVTDNPDKINEFKISMISKLVFRTAWRAANSTREFSYIEPN